MALVFKFYDFDSDGYVDADDVRLIMAYATSPESESKDSKILQRQTYSNQIDKLVEKVFNNRVSLILADFCDLTLNVCSEMFVAVMKCLHEKLPFSEFVLRQKVIFKESQIKNQQQKMVGFVATSGEEKVNPHLMIKA